MKLRCLLFVGLALAGCSPGGRSGSGPDARFDAYKNRFIEALWRQNPEYASSQGYHKFDSLLVIPDAAQRQADAAFAARHLAALATFGLDSLAPNNQIDLRLLRNELRAQRWYADTLQSWQWNPAAYNLGASVGELLNGRHYRLDRRLRNISDKISRAAAYYAAARANLSTPTREHTALALKQNAGGLAVFGAALADSVRKSTLGPAEKDTLTARIAAARRAVQGYLTHLQTAVLPAGKFRSFRIGRALFAQKFAYDIQSRFTADEVYRQALRHKAELLHDMGRRAARLFPKYFPGQNAPADTLALITAVVNQLTLKHAPREGFVEAVKRQIPTLVAFVNEHRLLTQDPRQPLVVRETPLYMRGVAGASVSAPGPYRPQDKTFYNVTPLDGMTAEEAESSLRENNLWMLQILNIHEAIPGHYAQLVYANKSPSLVKSLFGNGAMVEGWAVYAERMMLESGYGDNAPEMWLMYCKWNLRSVTNTILDYGVHVQGMTQAQAMDLLVRQAFQTNAQASEKWRRVQLSSVQLTSYFSGYSEIMELREQRKQALGPRFVLKDFHEQFLSYGNAPVKVIKELMSQ